MLQALDDAVSDGMDIVSLSFGGAAFTGPLDTGSACGLAAGTPCDPLAFYYERAAAIGTVILVAAGNEGEDGNNYPTLNTISTPADAPSVIAVGGTSNTHGFTADVEVASGPGISRSIAAVLKPTPNRRSALRRLRSST